MQKPVHRLVQRASPFEVASHCEAREHAGELADGGTPRVGPRDGGRSAASTGTERPVGPRLGPSFRGAVVLRASPEAWIGLFRSRFSVAWGARRVLGHVFFRNRTTVSAGYEQRVLRARSGVAATAGGLGSFWTTPGRTDEPAEEVMMASVHPK